MKPPDVPKLDYNHPLGQMLFIETCTLQARKAAEGDADAAAAAAAAAAEAATKDIRHLHMFGCVAYHL